MVRVINGEGRIDRVRGLRSCRYFPDGTDFYRGPHWHLHFWDGFRQNLPERYYTVVRGRS